MGIFRLKLLQMPEMKSAGVLKSKCDFKGGTLICLLVYVVFTNKATEVGSAAGCCAKDSESL